MLTRRLSSRYENYHNLCTVYNVNETYELKIASFYTRDLLNKGFLVSYELIKGAAFRPTGHTM